MSGKICWKACAAALALAATAAGPAAAQGAGDAAPPLTALSPPVNPAYDGVTRFRRLQTRITYVDRLSGDIPMDGAPAPPAPGGAAPDASGGPTATTALTRAALALLAVALGVGLWRARHVLAERLGRGPHDARAAARGAGPRGGTQAPPADPDGFLGALRARADREAALAELTRAALLAAAAANGLRLGRSETARDLLRRLPAGWGHHGALARLVRVEELVQFGGRPLRPETFLSCLDAARPILRTGHGA